MAGKMDIGAGRPQMADDSWNLNHELLGLWILIPQPCGQQGKWRTGIGQVGHGAAVTNLWDHGMTWNSWIFMEPDSWNKFSMSWIAFRSWRFFNLYDEHWLSYYTIHVYIYIYISIAYCIDIYTLSNIDDNKNIQTTLVINSFIEFIEFFWPVTSGFRNSFIPILSPAWHRVPVPQLASKGSMQHSQGLLPPEGLFTSSCGAAKLAAPNLKPWTRLMWDLPPIVYGW